MTGTSGEAPVAGETADTEGGTCGDPGAGEGSGDAALFVMDGVDAGLLAVGLRVAGCTEGCVGVAVCVLVAAGADGD